ncbi:MAG: aminopeptidase N [Pseudomonadota bacterium]|nr:aminopeptidase N [Pseudomonadota bacterium]
MQQSVTKLSEYLPPSYSIEKIDLKFELSETATIVTATLVGHKNADSEDQNSILKLNGENQRLVSLKLNETFLNNDDFELDGGVLTFKVSANDFQVIVVSEINPSDNKALEGLYLSDGIFCTQCEPEGFRRITFFPDRPDILSIYTTTIIADKGNYPILLSNGNVIDAGNLSGGRHFMTWHDPFPKPSYLFALVGGNLDCLEDSFTTKSGRLVTLKILVEPGNKPKSYFAMECLKKAMKWDEDRFGLEYDLDLFMIVAVSHFNMGAMENKGLNIFNSRYILADNLTATDSDFQRIEEIIAHEYFHNWTGNRVTCRDWFQLSLKEGLTVFRDQEYTSDMYSRGLKRINDVKLLRAVQFPEDASPTSHPVRPDAYVEINNFYTPTVYEKGAEIIRLIHTFLGEENFQKGMKLYVSRYDGQAVTCEDFLSAMQDASNKDLSLFKRWYSQSGTPELNVDINQDAQSNNLHITFDQETQPTADQVKKKPLPLIIEIGLLDRKGRPCLLNIKGDTGNGAFSKKLEISKKQTSFTFENIKTPVVPSILRNFSSPIKLLRTSSEEELQVLMRYELDPYVRWDAFQTCAFSLIKELVEKKESNEKTSIDSGYGEAIKTLLLDKNIESALKAEFIKIPTEREIAERFDTINVEAIHKSRQTLCKLLARKLKLTFEEVYYKARDAHSLDDLSNKAMGARLLANTVLEFLVKNEDHQSINLAFEQAVNTNSMTMVIGGLSALNNIDSSQRREALSHFYKKWQDDPLELDKWFSFYATCTLPNAEGDVLSLVQHSKFDITNPNRVRSLLNNFATNNPLHFHNNKGSGYQLISDNIIHIDRFNPQLAARLVLPLTRWQKHNSHQKGLMIDNLQKIKAENSLSNDVDEIVSKGLIGAKII